MSFCVSLLILLLVNCKVGALNVMSENGDLCLDLSEDDPFYQHKKVSDLLIC